MQRVHIDRFHSRGLKADSHNARDSASMQKSAPVEQQPLVIGGLKGRSGSGAAGRAPSTFRNSLYGC